MIDFGKYAAILPATNHPVCHVKKSKMEIPKRQERLCLHLPDSDGSHSVGFPGDANGAAITKTPPSYRKSEKIIEMSEKSGTSRRRQWCHNHQDTTLPPKKY